MSSYYNIDQIVDKHTKTITGFLKDQLEEGDDRLIHETLEVMAGDIVCHIIGEIRNM